MTTPRRRLWPFQLGVASFTLLGCASSAFAQRMSHDSRPATAAEVVGGNILIGALTAATRAVIGGRDPWNAFSRGALGGAVHVAGKYLSVEPGRAMGWVGLAVASTGTSMVSNAGNGVGTFQELSIPIASARLRVTPGERRKVRVVVNGYESALVLGAALADGLAIDWTQTVSSGAVVFETRGRRIVRSGERASGLAWGPVVLVDPLSFDPARTVRHEVVHVHQHWFVADAWGRPIEEFLRKKIPGGRHVPSWLQLGLESVLWTADGWLFRRAGLEALQEAEAERLERR